VFVREIHALRGIRNPAAGRIETHLRLANQSFES
jgi:hypothetical protein